MSTPTEADFYADQSGVTEDEGTPRDQYGRPMILPPPGVEPEVKSGKWAGYTPYSRASGFGGQIEDDTNLVKWQKRQVARGTALLYERVKLAPGYGNGLPADPAIEPVDSYGKKQWDALAARAEDEVGSYAKADRGTAIHFATECIDKGDTDTLARMPADLQERAVAYRTFCTEWGIVPTSIEEFGVEDEHRVAGTWDRTGHCLGRHRILDVKGLALDTPLATPTGWTTMGEVAIGDLVLGQDGRPARVALKSPPKRIGTYVVTFDDGSKITCDSEHIWWTQADGEKAPSAKSVRAVMAGLVNPRTGQRQQRVPIARPLDLPEAALPLQPYLLGAWLGDGTASKGEITKEHALFDIIEADGVTIKKRSPDSRRPHVVKATFEGLTLHLRALRLLNNKHIPAAYLRASTPQRLALLRGLMDTDGTWNTARDRAEFCTTDPALAGQVMELLYSLGQHPHRDDVERTGFGKTVDAYIIGFTPIDLVPFRLPRKVAKVVLKAATRARRRLIVSVEPGPDVETACIGVDSDSHLYLAGREMIPTHNTSSSMNFAGIGFAVQLAQYAHASKYDHETGERTPHGDMDLETAYIIHVDRNEGGPVELFKVDIGVGWRYAQTVNAVIQARRDGRKAISEVPERLRLILLCKTRAELKSVMAATVGHEEATKDQIATANDLWKVLPA